MYTPGVLYVFLCDSVQYLSATPASSCHRTTAGVKAVLQKYTKIKCLTFDCAGDQHLHNKAVVVHSIKCMQVYNAKWQ